MVDPNRSNQSGVQDLTPPHITPIESVKIGRLIEQGWFQNEWYLSGTSVAATTTSVLSSLVRSNSVLANPGNGGHRHPWIMQSFNVSFLFLFWSRASGKNAEPRGRILMIYHYPAINNKDAIKQRHHLRTHLTYFALSRDWKDRHTPSLAINIFEQRESYSNSVADMWRLMIPDLIARIAGPSGFETSMRTRAQRPFFPKCKYTNNQCFQVEWILMSGS